MRFIFSVLIAFYILLLRLTCRVRIHGAQKMLPDQPHILACWHGRLLLCAPIWLKNKSKGAKMTILSSEHADGKMIAQATGYLGLNAVLGSATRGGAKAIRGLSQAAKNGHHIFITPDGPKGPRHEAKPGAVDISRLTGLPILPISVSANGRTMNSWDNFLFIKPFSKIHVVLGDAIPVSQKEDRATATERLTKILITLEQQADDLRNPC